MHGQVNFGPQFQQHWPTPSAQNCHNPIALQGGSHGCSQIWTHFLSRSLEVELAGKSLPIITTSCRPSKSCPAWQTSHPVSIISSVEKRNIDTDASAAYVQQIVAFEKIKGPKLPIANMTAFRAKKDTWLSLPTRFYTCVCLFKHL